MIGNIKVFQGSRKNENFMTQCKVWKVSSQTLSFLPVQKDSFRFTLTFGIYLALQMKVHTEGACWPKEDRRRVGEAEGQENGAERMKRGERGTRSALWNCAFLPFSRCSTAGVGLGSMAAGRRTALHCLAARCNNATTLRHPPTAPPLCAGTAVLPTADKSGKE